VLSNIAIPGVDTVLIETCDTRVGVNPVVLFVAVNPMIDKVLVKSCETQEGLDSGISFRVDTVLAGTGNEQPLATSCKNGDEVLLNAISVVTHIGSGDGKPTLSAELMLGVSSVSFSDRSGTLPRGLTSGKKLSSS